MGGEALAFCVARSSATMVLTMQDKPVLAFREERFQLPSQCQFQVIIEKKIYHRVL